MKSKTSVFDTGIFKNLLKRFWPVFLVYFIILFLSLPGELARPYNGLGYRFSYQVLWQAVTGTKIAIFAGAGAAMCMFSFMYTQKGTGMMASLPVRRETVFVTSYIAGLVPIVAVNVIVFLFMLVYEVSQGAVYPGFLFTWLAAVTLADIFYYSFASFAAQLTGSLIVLPAVYAILLMTCTVVEECFIKLFDIFLYGYAPGARKLSFLSPPAYFEQKVTVESNDMFNDIFYDYSSIKPMVCSLKGMGVLAIYALIGLLFAYLALRLYRKRRMETATDIVSIEILKPIFKYCLAFGCALAASDYFGGSFIPENAPNIEKLAFILFVMIVSAFIGYFAAEMLIKKSTKVFRASWKGFVPVACVLVLFCTLLNADITGFEENIPEAGEIESVEFNYGDTLIKDPANIEKTLEGHRAIVRNRPVNTDPYGGPGYYVFRMTYTLKNGKEMRREYTLVEDETAAANKAFDSAINSREGKHFRFEPLFGITGDTGYGCNINVNWYDVEKARYESDYTYLSGDQFREFVYSCLIPDLENTSLGDAILFYNEETGRKLTTIGVDIYERNAVVMNAASKYMYMQVSTDARHTLDWIRENTDFIIITSAENDANIPVSEGWATDGNAVPVYAEEAIID